MTARHKTQISVNIYSQDIYIACVWLDETVLQDDTEMCCGRSWDVLKFLLFFFFCIPFVVFARALGFRTPPVLMWVWKTNEDSVLLRRPEVPRYPGFNQSVRQPVAQLAKMRLRKTGVRIWCAYDDLFMCISYKHTEKLLSISLKSRIRTMGIGLDSD